MRMSCNGCRVLRKGCSEDCTIRPCLQWIGNPEAQGNATVFLAKFYGRAGLLNLIGAGPDHLRPAIFRSLLYEACGRIVNPIYGSVGLLWSGKWQLCQAAVEAVLKGEPVDQISPETATSTPVPPMKAFDIRHVAKDDALHRVDKASRTRFKRSAACSSDAYMERYPVDLEFYAVENMQPRERSHDSSSTPPVRDAENDSVFSVETVEATLVKSQGRAAAVVADGCSVRLELTLGSSSSSSPSSSRSNTASPTSSATAGRQVVSQSHCDRTVDRRGCGPSRIDLGLHLKA